jgi:hypothetical protein
MPRRQAGWVEGFEWSFFADVLGFDIRGPPSSFQIRRFGLGASL